MKKSIIGALVGAIILFFWQFLSWNFMHKSQLGYTPNQDEILELLDGKLEPGQYFLPTVPDGTTPTEADFEKYLGKRWIQINYRESLDMKMGTNLVRGFTIDFVAAFLLCWIFGKISDFDMKTSVMVSLAVGLIGYFTISYLNSIWFETNSLPDLIDAIVPWALIGVWLGWWLRK